MQSTNNCKEAYLTVYLSLTMAVLLSLCLTLLEGVRRSAAGVETECIMDMGLNSMLAEYHRELFEQYNLFAVDASYGTGVCGKVNTENHLKGYLDRNMSLEDIFFSEFWYRDFLRLSVTNVDLTRVSFLTDEKGSLFRKRAIEAVKDDIGLTLFEELLDWVGAVEEKGLEEYDASGLKQKMDDELQEYTGVENPTWRLEEKRKQGILKQVVENPAEISNNTVNVDSLINSRMKQGRVNVGNGKLLEEENGLLEQYFFHEYLMRYMGCYGEEMTDTALRYQLEYLIAGKSNDTENLRVVVNRIFALREATNTLCIYSDSEKCAEAEVLALALSTLLTVPEITDVLKQILLLGWAYAESVYDMKQLLDGQAVPLIKTTDTWHLGLSSALLADFTDDSDGDEGIFYADYLRIFLMCMERDTVTGRAMDMVEADIRMTPGNQNFRLDGCIDNVEAEVHVKSAYGYEYEIIRQAGY